MTSDSPSPDYSIRVTCFDGADGTIIRIDTQSHRVLMTIRDTFLNLAGGKVESVEFLNIDGVMTDGIGSLTLQLVQREPSKTLKCVDCTHDDPEYIWRWHPDGWLDCVWMLNGMLQSEKPGHQYLTNSLDDDATVVVAYGEV